MGEGLEGKNIRLSSVGNREWRGQKGTEGQKMVVGRGRESVKVLK